MTLKEYIFERFKGYNMGKRNSITRQELNYKINSSSVLEFLYGESFGKITDREMRAAYEDLPVCGGSQGLYLPETQAEIDEQIELHKKKIRAYAMKIKVLKRYKISTDSVQKELF